MIGYAAVFIALVAAGAAVFCYLNAFVASFSRRADKRVDRGERTGLCLYRLSAGGVMCASLYLFYIILTDQFQFAYVFGHSARDLGLAYKFSAFWAGQEGSFLLWALFHAGFGLIAFPRKNFPGAWAVYCGVQCMLLVTLLAKSPFMMIVGQQPDGFGLNPLLEDPWMVIHPPLVFLGYAGLAVPFAYAIDGMVSGRHQEWAGRSLPWALFAWALLGAGIFIGGFWAYKVLGWGGYWAWDPVENSSLVPWLACGALIHLQLIVRVRAAAARPAYFAALCTFVLVMYGTFLTRSGLLSDFSTHSFADEGVGGLLACFVLITAVLSLGLLVVRWPTLPDGAVYPAIKSREFHLAAAAVAFAVIGVIVLVGMSTPLVTMLIGQPQNVSLAFYNMTTLPLAALLAMLLVTGQLVGWGDNTAPLLTRYWWLVLLGHIAAIAAFWGGVRPLAAVVTVGLAAAALAAGAIAVATKKINRSGAFAHIGVASALIGILFSSLASQSMFLSLEKGESQQVLGGTLTYLGDTMLDNGKGFYQSFKLAGTADTVVAALTKLNKEGRHAAHEPGIYRGLAADMYLAPVARHEESQLKEIGLGKEQTAEEAGLAIKLIRYGMGGNPGSGDIRVYALLEVTKDGKTLEARPELVSQGGQIVSVPLTVFDHYQLNLVAVSPSQNMVGLGVKDLTQPPEERVDVEVSRKPLISLVWLGTICATAGTLGAGVMRIRKKQ